MFNLSNQRTIISCGRPGVGKSSLGNSLLYGDPNYSYGFHSCVDPQKYGVTREIQKRTEYVDYLQTSLQYIDIPGQGDHTINMNELAESLSKKLKNVTINAVLFLVAAQDNRLSYPELSTISFIKNFFQSTGYDQKKLLWLVITRCGETRPSRQFIQDKLTSIKKHGLSISSNNVVEYDFQLIKFKPFIEQLAKVPVNQGFVIKKNQKNPLNDYFKDIQKHKSIDLIRKEREEQEQIERERKRIQRQIEEEEEKQKRLQRQIEANERERKQKEREFEREQEQLIQRQNYQREMEREQREEMQRERRRQERELQEERERQERLEWQQRQNERRIRELRDRDNCTLI